MLLHEAVLVSVVFMVTVAAAIAIACKQAKQAARYSHTPPRATYEQQNQHDDIETQLQRRTKRVDEQVCMHPLFPSPMYGAKCAGAQMAHSTNGRACLYMLCMCVHAYHVVSAAILSEESTATICHSRGMIK
jgi:hypothetical protein